MSPVELTDRRGGAGGAGGAKSYDNKKSIMILYKSFNTFWSNPSDTHHNIISDEVFTLAHTYS
jgi:hypothetical protein